MPSEEEANGKKKIDAGASPAPAPPPSSSSSRPPPSQPPPAYAQAKNAYEALWKQQSDTRPLATQAPASGARTAAAASPRPEAAATGVNAAAAARSPPTPPPLKLHAFQKLVGDEAFIPASSLKILKRIGAGSFATGERVFSFFGVGIGSCSTLFFFPTSSLSLTLLSFSPHPSISLPPAHPPPIKNKNK